MESSQAGEAAGEGNRGFPALLYLSRSTKAQGRSCRYKSSFRRVHFQHSGEPLLVWDCGNPCRLLLSFFHPFFLLLLETLSIGAVKFPPPSLWCQSSVFLSWLVFPEAGNHGGRRSPISSVGPRSLLKAWIPYLLKRGSRTVRVRIALAFCIEECFCLHLSFPFGKPYKVLFLIKRNLKSWILFLGLGF